MKWQRLVAVTFLSVAGIVWLLASETEAQRRVKGDDAGSDLQEHNSTAIKETKDRDRERRILSIFSIVQFANSPCLSTSSLSKGNIGRFRNGTCFTSVECSRNGGTAAGSCAGGFGVCCVFSTTTTGSTVRRNCTYIQNPSFPSATTTSTAQSYTLAKCSCDVCFFRLDFDCFTITGPADTVETNGGQCATDTFTVTASSGITTPVICGENSGMHMYIDAGAACSDTVTLAFAFTGTQTRQWDIKISQVPCGSTYTPPEGCLQYHTGLDGRFSSFNFADTTTSHLASQDYSICIRAEEGYCCIMYQPCADANSFTLDTISTTTGLVGTNCVNDYVGVQGSSSVCNGGTTNNLYCGVFFSSTSAAIAHSEVCDCTQPFAVDIFTNTAAETAATNNRGVCLTYTQVPCN